MTPLAPRARSTTASPRGSGQATREHAVYDEHGAFINGSFQDYAMPRAEHVSEMVTGNTETPSPLNQFGVKGTGEAGTIAAPPAYVNAVLDALEPFGVETIDMPVTDETVWRAVAGSSTVRPG